MIESTALDLTIVNVINLHKQSTFVLQYLIIKVALCSKALLIVVLTCRLIHLKITTFSLLKTIQSFIEVFIATLKVLYLLLFDEN
jgi:hypothetical protein